MVEQTNLVDLADKEKYLDKFKKVLLEVDINKVSPNEWNPNRHGAESYQTLINSIKKFGFNDPVSVRQVIAEVDDYEIIDGEHRWKAAKELGFSKVIVINFGEITKQEAMTLTQLLNHRGKDDVLLKAKLLKELQAGQASLFSLLPGSERDKDETIKLLDFDFSQFDNQEEVEEDPAKAADNDFKLAYKKALELEIVLRRLKESSNNEKLRIAIEQYYTFAQMLKSYLPVKAKKGKAKEIEADTKTLPMDW